MESVCVCVLELERDKTLPFPVSRLIVVKFTFSIVNVAGERRGALVRLIVEKAESVTVSVPLVMLIKVASWV